MRYLIGLSLLLICGTSQADTVYRVANATEDQVTFSVRGNGSVIEIELPANSWANVKTHGEAKNRVVVLDKGDKQVQYTHIRFDRLPDKHGVGLPIVFVDKSSKLHLLRLGSGTLVLLDHVSNRELDDNSIPRAYSRHGRFRYVGDGNEAELLDPDVAQP